MVRFLDELPKAQKEIIYQRLYQDLSFKEIAESEGISINTALGRMRYALINMRKLMDKYEVVADI
jgi:RNA polymerase sigma-70 factor (ECF subfamily)